ncbi:sugar transferase [Croceicoccus pelagius]|uniref:Bacterial sugar transferase domain-containing protein n=1 Tax=Croceicoccus pelagius TaxID=1703341 RepID=A0A917DKN8_9SPHN|nr:sugar transferase [Croceicoccus pelagius]GGD48081.1 hypothetical protein GCM10010989_23050 [Croceicoccus pelagius]
MLATNNDQLKRSDLAWPEGAVNRPFSAGRGANGTCLPAIDGGAVVASPSAALSTATAVEPVAASAVEQTETFVFARSQNGITRCIDLTGAVLLLVFLLPVMVIVAVAIRIFDPGPALYRQARVGRDGSDFACLKFRSMRCDSAEVLRALLETDAAASAEWALNQKLANDPRITPLGAFLRATSLDELPQLFNVIRGDMSLVGPRPIVSDEVPRYGRFIAHYHATKPGLTGLWQVTGRSGTTYRRRVATDRYYACSRTIGMDLRIMAATIPAVVFRKGAV